MLGLVLAVLVGVAVGLLTGGSLRNLSTARVRAYPLLLAAVALQVGALGLDHAHVARWVVLTAIFAGYACVIGWAMRNRQRLGMAFIAVGTVANAVVTAANGAMPVSLSAARRAGLNVDVVRHAFTIRAAHEPLTASTRLSFLADVIAIPRNVVSVGDIALWMGVAILLAALCRPEEPPSEVSNVPNR